VTAAWLAALGQPHGRYTRVEAWYGGVFATVVPAESGSVQVTARNRVRRQLSVVVPESFWPTGPADPLTVYGGQLKVFQGVTGVDGVLIGSEVPVFAGRVEQVGQRDRKTGRFPAAAVDPFADVNDAEFEAPRTVAANTSVVGAITALIAEVHPDAQFLDFTGTTAILPAGIMWTQDRGQAIDDLAASIGAEVFFRPDGVTCVIRPVPTLTGVPVWSLTQGQGGTLVRDVQSKSRSGVANRVVVHVEQPGATPILVTVTDDDPSSATHYGGPYGRVVRNWSNPLVRTSDQAQVAGLARLARSIGATRTRDVDTVPNPALEAGDLIQVVTDDGTALYIADAFPVPLDVTGGMTINTRSTGTSTA